ncbi:sigma-70 family RNA polymerase sigma factor [Bordetella sp. BOR01]|uniref:sigma-70 family RNA polymerase sigma factor n=1 Tax=Bordetella sp. BOR01 TaxID=2854779 RepID=UPI002106B17A|nr:sigma-70 family RNA polymerase sigma factor [Bordetella sp. BOR01]
MKTPPERSIVNAAQSPYLSSPSIDTLYTDHHAWLRAWLQRRLGNAADAADLAHEAFLRLILKPASRGFNSKIEARAYLRTMAQGMCVNLWRRREIEQAWLDTLAAQPQGFAPSAERQATVLQALQEIAELLMGLPGKAAQAFLMSAVCGMTAAEVGSELGVSSRMVRKYVAQAMLRCMQAHAAHTAAALRQAPMP